MVRIRPGGVLAMDGLTGRPAAVRNSLPGKICRSSVGPSEGLHFLDRAAPADPPPYAPAPRATPPEFDRKRSDCRVRDPLLDWSGARRNLGTVRPTPICITGTPSPWANTNWRMTVDWLQLHG